MNVYVLKVNLKEAEYGGYKFIEPERTVLDTALWSSTFWFLSYYHLIPNITDDVRLLTTISLIMTLPFIISFYILFEFGDKILKKYEKDNNGNN